MKTTSTPSLQRRNGNFFLFFRNALRRQSVEPTEKTSRSTEILCIAAFFYVLAVIGILLCTRV